MKPRNAEEQAFWDACFLEAMKLWPLPNVRTAGFTIAVYAKHVADESLRERRGEDPNAPP